MTVKIEMEGLDAAIQEITNKLRDYCLFYMEAGAKRNAPKDTGYMASQIYSKPTGNGSGEVVSPVGYSGYVEFGTQNIKVGTPEKPRTEWEALRKRGGRGQTMPFMRPQVYKLEAHLSGLSGEEWQELMK